MKVVDASAVAAILFDEPAGERIALQVRGEILIAPALLHFEIAHTCLKKMRERPHEIDGLLEAMGSLTAWNITLRGVDLAAAASLAYRHSLSAYDASYLWLVRTFDAELVTLDTKLAKAAASFSRGQ